MEKHETLHSKLNRHLENQSKHYTNFIYAKEKGFYQGFDEIHLEGCRSTEKRFENYNIEHLLSREKTGLDIGCNCGFFSIYVSRFLGSMDGIDINPYLINIANDTKNYLNIDNLNFETSSFENFTTHKTYDLIFSLANDETIDGLTKFSFTEYIKKITNLLKDSGYLIFESQAEDVILDEKFNQKLEVLKNFFDIVENRSIDSEYPVNVPTRFFLILKQK